MELSSTNYDFAGWATRSNQLCADGRTILPDAFKHQDGDIVPLIWNHQHNDPFAVLGKALLHCVDGDVYAYCSFNDTESGNTAKELVKHGDVCSLSICANHLKHNANRGVMHGIVRELSLVVAGANPKARIEDVNLAHSDDGGEYVEEIHIYTDESIELFHSDDLNKNEKEEKEMGDTESKNSEKTLKDIYEAMSDEQQQCCDALVGIAVEEVQKKSESMQQSDNLEGGNDTMKHHIFENNEENQVMLTHADQEAIIALAKQSNCGSFKQAVEMYAAENEELAHGIFENYDVLFPEYELLRKGEPETLEKYDQTWVEPALAKIHKSPFSRIRTRYADARIAELKAKGYQNKGDQKTLMNKIKMIGRTTDPQTIYIKDDMHRDDVIDITDFSVVDYQWKMMRRALNETLVLAALIGDGREEGDPDKIHEAHIRSIWNDDELYTIHKDVDIAAAKKELQGTNTNANFGENYIYAEAIITAALYSREKFKGTGTPDFYCTPHLVNVMLLARDLNGRRIYESKSDLAKALNVNSIVEVEQFEGKTRTTDGGKTKKLLGIFVNLNDYQFGSTKGGEITRFDDFDMDFNVQKFMLETRLSGSLTRVEAAVVLEEPVTGAAG
ncbi:MAG: HK97 family phage prohead protease [Lachnospiraceae bacterium]|nr:HK97 family phage prohead protease [Lachnospiraceae bacterium]